MSFFLKVGWASPRKGITASARLGDVHWPRLWGLDHVSEKATKNMQGLQGIIERKILTSEQVALAQVALAQVAL
jgi:hypothetical protein